MIKWERSSAAWYGATKIIKYTSQELPGIVIESQRHRIKNDSPQGYWEHTTYVLKVGEEIAKEYWRLADAKAAAEKMKK